MSETEVPNRRVAVEQARRAITQLINLKEIRPGAKLPSADALAQEIGVSRPVVLDALKIIQAEGKIVVRPGRAGATVLQPAGPQLDVRVDWIYRNRATISQMTLLREMIEPGIARILAEKGMSAEFEARARELLAAMSADGASRFDHLAMDHAFHRLIAEATGMAVLVDLEVEVRTWVAPAFDIIDWPDGRRHQSEKEHTQILQAILAGNPKAAQAAALAHLDKSSSKIISTLTDEGHWRERVAQLGLGSGNGKGVPGATKKARSKVRPSAAT
jgi:GntR family transcriptional repressor for pyruvate dehydrogenase complex